jgi:LmbE family N-acetylglucosaminyl deacetylase
MLLTGLVQILTLLLLSPAPTEAPVNVYPRIARPAAADRILIVAPHIDDEAIGAAGYAIDAVASGAQVYVAFVTAGDCGRVSARVVNKSLGTTPSSYLKVGRARIAEAKSAMTFVGVPKDHYFILGYPDQGLRKILDNRQDIVRSKGTRQRAVPYEEAMTPGSPYRFDSLLGDFERVLEIARPTIVVFPVAFDRHSDHSATAELTDLALEAAGIHPQRLGYLVHANRIKSLVRARRRPLVPPARMRQLTWATYPLTPELQKRKDALLQIYKSQRPYTAILRNTFVRTNELFLVYDEGSEATVAAAAEARVPISR